LANSGCDPAELVAVLFSMNYRVRRLDREGYPEVTDPDELAGLTVSDRNQFDLLAVPSQ
jgi:hypothetical protein